jgi:hypothetical protein
VTDDRSSFRRRFDFVALLFGLAALTVQAIAPICLSGFPPGRSADGFSIVLCTVHGFQTVTLDANGKPLPATPDKSNPDGLCPICTAFHAAPLLGVAAAFLLAVLLSWRSVDPVAHFAPPLLRRAYTSFVTRGPPLRLASH